VSSSCARSWPCLIGQARRRKPHVSSLGSLRSFPFDKIKIDRSFVSELERDEDSAAIVRAVLSLGRSLGMSTCAEGVETEGQLERLRMEGLRRGPRLPLQQG